MSGQAPDVVEDRGIPREGVPLVRRPFSIPELSATLRTTLDAP